jgi:hypothetical protein
MLISSRDRDTSRRTAQPPGCTSKLIEIPPEIGIYDNSYDTAQYDAVSFGGSFAIIAKLNTLKNLWGSEKGVLLMVQ